jgi:hypothetical protein
VLDWLTRRFKQEPPKDLAEKVLACEDLAKLQEWFVLVVEATALDQFREKTGL